MWRVAHLAVQLSLGDERGDGIDDQHVNGAGADEGFGNLQSLFAAIRLRNQQVIDIDAQLFGVGGVEGVLRVDKGRQAAGLLRLGNDLQRDGGLARGLRAENLNDAAAGNAAHAQSGVES